MNKFKYLSIVASSVLLFTACGDKEHIHSKNTEKKVDTKFTITGYVIDDPVVDGKVCLDANSNHICDASEPFGITNEKGWYSFEVDKKLSKGDVILDSNTGKINDVGETIKPVLETKIEFSKDNDHVNITPATTLLSKFVEANMPLAIAKQQIKEILGLDSVDDVTSIDKKVQGKLAKLHKAMIADKNGYENDKEDNGYEKYAKMLAGANAENGREIGTKVNAGLKEDLSEKEVVEKKPIVHPTPKPQPKPDPKPQPKPQPKPTPKVIVQDADAPAVIPTVLEANLKNSAKVNPDKKQVWLTPAKDGDEFVLDPLFVLNDKQDPNLSGEELSLYTDANHTTDIRYEIVEPSDYVVKKGYNKYGEPFWFISPKTGYTPKAGDEIKVKVIGTKDGQEYTTKEPAVIKLIDKDLKVTPTDDKAPTVKLSSPLDKEDVKVDTPIEVTFDEKVKEVTAEDVVLKADGKEVEVQVLVGKDGKVTIKPKGGLKPDTTYTLVLKDSITDEAGNKLKEKEFTFITKAKEVTPPVQEECKESPAGIADAYAIMSAKISGTSGDGAVDIRIAKDGKELNGSGTFTDYSKIVSIEVNGETFTAKDDWRDYYGTLRLKDSTPVAKKFASKSPAVVKVNFEDGSYITKGTKCDKEVKPVDPKPTEPTVKDIFKLGNEEYTIKFSDIPGQKAVPSMQIAAQAPMFTLAYNKDKTGKLEYSVLYIIEEASRLYVNEFGSLRTGHSDDKHDHVEGEKVMTFEKVSGFDNYDLSQDPLSKKWKITSNSMENHVATLVLDVKADGVSKGQITINIVDDSTNTNPNPVTPKIAIPSSETMDLEKIKVAFKDYYKENDTRAGKANPVYVFSDNDITYTGEFDKTTTQYDVSANYRVDKCYLIRGLNATPVEKLCVLPEYNYTPKASDTVKVKFKTKAKGASDFTESNEMTITFTGGSTSPAAGDNEAPTVTSVVPADGTEAEVDADIVVTFSEKIKESTKTGIELQDDTGAVVSSTVTFDAEGKVATINPNADLTPGKEYKVVLKADITDEANNALAAQETSFTTKAAIVTPSTDFIKTNDTIKRQGWVKYGIGINADAGTSGDGSHQAQAHIFTDVSNVDLSTVTWDLTQKSKDAGLVKDGKEVKLYEMPVGTKIEIKVKGKKKDGTDFEGIYTLEVVGDSTPTDNEAPTVTSVVPADGTEAEVDADIVVTFSEKIKESTKTGIELQDDTGAVVSSTVTFDAEGKVATINPNADLTPGKEYKVVLKADITDEANNALAAQETSFTTKSAAVDPCPTSGSGVADGYAITEIKPNWNKTAFDIQLSKDGTVLNGNGTFKDYAKVTSIVIGGETFSDSTAWRDYYGSIRLLEDKAPALKFKADSSVEVRVVFDDGSFIRFGNCSATNGPKVADGYAITEIKPNWNKTAFDIQLSKDGTVLNGNGTFKDYAKVTSIVIGGETFSDSTAWRDYYGSIRLLEDKAPALKFKADSSVKVKVVFDDGSFIEK